jgi:hypothetical protein
MTSQQPSARTPPQGPLRIFLGQFIGHVIPVLCSMHWPHIWQLKSQPLVISSPHTIARSTKRGINRFIGG